MDTTLTERAPEPGGRTAHGTAPARERTSNSGGRTMTRGRATASLMPPAARMPAVKEGLLREAEEGQAKKKALGREPRAQRRRR